MLTVALGAPGVTGVIAKVEARLQGRRGPRVLQLYYDLAKLSRKEALAPEQASWFFLAAPLIAVTCYLTIPLLIPVMTSYGLPLGYIGDILGGGFLLSLASFVVATAALETGSPYAQLGSSRAKTFSAITELFVVFTVALLIGTDLPYALDARSRSCSRRMSLPQLSNSSPDRSWRTHTASESRSGTPCPDSTGPRLSIQWRVLYRIDESSTQSSCRISSIARPPIVAGRPV